MSANELWKKGDRCQHKKTYLEGMVDNIAMSFVHVKWDDGHEDLTLYTLLQDPRPKPDVRDWEPKYGFCATDKHSNEELAMALESIRRKVCAYNWGRRDEDVRCDCKYGATVPSHGSLGSEKTGCPELREIIYRLLHKPESFGV